MWLRARSLSATPPSEPAGCVRGEGHAGMGCASGNGACGRTGNGGMKMTDCRVNRRRQPLCSTRLTRALRGVGTTVGKGLGLELKAHRHMLRHACGMPSPTEATIPGPFRMVGASLGREHSRPYRRWRQGVVATNNTYLLDQQK